jgi:serine/threonine protein kinase
MARQLGSSYVLEDLVGRGATGEVWSATHVPSDTRVAVKLLKPELAEDPELVARFVQERALLLGLDSPHLVKVRDLVVEGNTLAIVMDLVVGTDLRHLLRAERMTPELAINLATQVLEGLEAVHQAGVVHRDLKPENILIDQTSPGEPKALITDFGVARLAHGPSLTKVTGLIGTPIYMAPELSERGAPTASADIYSAGIVLYEMLSGRPPFDASHPMAVLRAHLEEEPPPIPGLPNAVRVVLASMLEKQPADRPPSAHDARTRLEQARSSVAGLAPLLPAAADAAGDPYATTIPDLGETRLGSRRSNPPGDTPLPTPAPTEPVAVTATGGRGARQWLAGRSRRAVVGAVVAAVVLVGGVAFAARGSGGGGPKLVDATSTPTTHAHRTTSTTAKKAAKAKKSKKSTKKTTTTTKAPTKTTPATAPPAGGGTTHTPATQPVATAPPATSPATSPPTAPPTTQATAPPTTVAAPYVGIQGATVVCANLDNWQYQAVGARNVAHGQWRNNDGSKTWNMPPYSQISLTFSQVGSYRITLTVWNSAGQSYTAGISITAKQCP